MLLVSSISKYNLKQKHLLRIKKFCDVYARHCLINGFNTISERKLVHNVLSVSIEIDFPRILPSRVKDFETDIFFIVNVVKKILQNSQRQWKMRTLLPLSDLRFVANYSSIHEEHP